MSQISNARILSISEGFPVLLISKASIGRVDVGNFGFLTSLAWRFERIGWMHEPASEISNSDNTNYYKSSRSISLSLSVELIENGFRNTFQYLRNQY